MSGGDKPTAHVWRSQKCDQQLKADKAFFDLVDGQEPDRTKSSQEMVKAGIYYLNQEDYERSNDPVIGQYVY